jgi:hypothetical protein
VVVVAAGQAEVAVQSAVVASAVEAGCMRDVAFAMAARSSVAAVGDIVEVDVAAVVDTSAPSHHARPSHSDRG